MGIKPGSRSPASIVNKYIGTSYDVVKAVYDELDHITDVGDNADIAEQAAQVAVQSLQELTVMYEDFDKRFLGTFSTYPIQDNSGNPLEIGALIYLVGHSTDQDGSYVYGSSGWVPVANTISSDAAAASAEAAAISETNAETSATQASDSATAAANSEQAAQTSETNAGQSATNAANSEAAALAAKNATETLFDQFGDQYLGSHPSDPTTDNDGDPLNEGDVYWNSTDNVLKFYTGTNWVAPEDIATTAAQNALTSEQNAASSATSASDSANVAATSESNALTSSNLAENWATNGEDILVNGTEYSAKHYSIKASHSAAQADASTYLSLKIFQSPTDGGLTEIQTRTVDAGEVYEVRKTSDDSLATIYSDADGTTEIVQDGDDNKSGSDGVVEFFVAAGDYYVEVDGVKSNFTGIVKATDVETSDGRDVQEILDDLSVGITATDVVTTDSRNVQERLDDLPSEVDAAGIAETLISQHNSDAAAHTELSAFITAEADRAEAAADAVLVHQTTGVIVFTTFALLDAYTPANADEQKASYKVTNDPDSSLNGYYHWVSGTAYEKDADLVINEIDPANTSYAVSGQAVSVLVRSKVNTLDGADIFNGVCTELANITNITPKSVVTETNIAENYFVYSFTGLYNTWCLTSLFTPTVDSRVHVKFDVEFSNVGTDKGIVIVVADDPSVYGDFYENLATVNTDGSVDIYFDPKTYFDQYGTTEFYIWINNENIGETDTVTAKIMNFQVIGIEDVLAGNFLEGDNSQELFKSVDDNLSSLNEAIGNSTLDKVVNGSTIKHINISKIPADGSITEINVPDDYLLYSHTGIGNNWFSTDQFTPLGTNLVHIKFTVEFDNINTTKGLQLSVAEEESVGGFYQKIGNVINEDGEVDISFDPAYYSVYKGFSSFYIWVNNEVGMQEGETVSAKISNFRIEEYTGSIEGTYISGKNAKEMFTAADKALLEISAASSKTATITGPNGKKYEIGVNALGEVKLLPIIPDKGTFFGNSLIAGFGFGMAASASDKDYYYLVTEYIKTLNSEFTHTKHTASQLEGIEDPGLIDSTIQSIVIDKLDGDETLVVIQLGDNVNTVAKNELFPDVALRLLQLVRNKCPNARVFWMGMWYGSSARYKAIMDACANTGSTFVNLEDLKVSGARNEIGNISNRGLQSRTLENVTNVVDNTATNITVTFLVAGYSYETSLDVTSYSLSGNTLTYTGDYYVITSGGVASHPSDYGFRLIANRFLVESQITTNEAIYSN